MIFKFLNKTILNGQFKSIEIPLVRQKMSQKDGFKSDEEAIKFSNNACGAACIKMVLSALKISSEMTVKEIQDLAIINKHYIEPDGFRHSGIVEILQSFGLKANAVRLKKADQLASLIENKNIIIASVSANFNQNIKGGHLIVLKSIEFENGILKSVEFNDPSGWGQSHSKIDGKLFMNSWSGRAILIRY